MTKKKLVALSMLGAIFAALLCFSPILLLIFGFFGLSAWAGYLDIISMSLVAAALIFLVFRMRKKASDKNPS